MPKGNPNHDARGRFSHGQATSGHVDAHHQQQAKKPITHKNMSEQEVRTTNIMLGKKNPPKTPPHRASVQGGQHLGDGKTTGGAFGRGGSQQPKYPNRGRT